MHRVDVSKGVKYYDGSKNLNLYFDEINKFKLLTPEEEFTIFKEIREAKEDKRHDEYRKKINIIVKANLRFAVSVAQQYSHPDLSQMDIISAANIGLIEAAEKFDETRGFKFISYAVWWVRLSIRQALREHLRQVRVPESQFRLYSKFEKAREKLWQEKEMEPTPSEIQEILISEGIENITMEDIAAGLILFNNHVTSLNTTLPSKGDSDPTLQDVIPNTQIPPPDKELDQQGLTQHIKDVLLDALNNERTVDILLSFFGIGMEYPVTPDEIAEKYELTSGRIQQIKKAALDKLKHIPEVEEELLSYLHTT